MISPLGDPQDSPLCDAPSSIGESDADGRSALERRSTLERRVIEVMDYLSPGVRKMQLEQLEAIRSDPARILDLGSMPAAEGLGDALERRYPKAQRIIADSASQATSSDAASSPRLSLPSDSADLLIATLSLSDLSPENLRKCGQALRPEGLMMLAALGEGSLDTLARLVSMAGEAVPGPMPASTPASTSAPARKDKALREDLQRLRIAVDMQRLGDAFFEAGFADVVVDIERISLGQAQVSILKGIMQSPSGSTQATGSIVAGEVAEDERDGVGMSQARFSISGKIGSGENAADAVMEIVFVHARCLGKQDRRGGESKGVVFPEFR
ncbi:hypothetical protein [Thioalkalivibrio sp. HK1]|uniref:hypothetical protein n=1 Tax=Thioalkalivibrio sp. HK1 TaxID=1469245 RepID=UPI00046F74C7|nr:hypothetical protein [Thioalkalivibrio sp. HK1]